MELMGLRTHGHKNLCHIFDHESSFHAAYCSIVITNTSTRENCSLINLSHIYGMTFQMVSHNLEMMSNTYSTLASSICASHSALRGQHAYKAAPYGRSQDRSVRAGAPFGTSKVRGVSRVVIQRFPRRKNVMLPPMASGSAAGFVSEMKSGVDCCARNSTL